MPESRNRPRCDRWSRAFRWAGWRQRSWLRRRQCLRVTPLEDHGSRRILVPESACLTRTPSPAECGS